MRFKPSPSPPHTPDYLSIPIEKRSSIHSRTMASNHGIPPPPPPHSSGGQDAGSMFPPPPPPQPNAQYYHQNHVMQQQHAFQHQHPPQCTQYQQYQQQYQAGQPAYQNGLYQQQMYQQQYHNQYQYPQYANNYGVPPPPPPPPPPQSNNWHNNNHNNNNNTHQPKGRNGQSKNSNANAAASLRQSLTPTKSNIPDEKSNNNKSINKKKINPKMAKKYAGRGLKTITIAGPGMPTQRFKICVGNHPEDIKKWIEERRKRFPRVNGSQRVTNNNNREAGQDLSGTKRSRQDEGNNVAEKRVCIDEKARSAGTSKEGEKTGGLSSLLAGYESSSSEEGEITTQSKPVDQLKDESTSPAVPSSEGDNTKSSVALDTSNNPQPRRICKFYQRGKCRHGTSCKFLHSDDNNQKDQSKHTRQSQSERDKARNEYQQELQILGLATPSHGSRYTSGGKVINSTSLLHKLLQKDKERERRLTLQLLRYIVDCDYFQGAGGDDGSKAEETLKEDEAAAK